MTAVDKATIYIDVDDEITGIIEKLRTSDGKIVALVLPKRASVFQSIVNMRLLKRAADQSKKHLVLITAEAGLLPLAGLAGVHVAKTLTSKPEVPLAPGQTDDDEETIQEDGEVLPADAVEKPVGELAAAAATKKASDDDVETLTLDDDEAPENLEDTPAVTPKTFEPPKGKKDKKLSIPNFEKFRLLLVLSGLVFVLLIAGLIAAVKILPKATITIKTDATNVSSNLNLNLSTAATTLRPSSDTVPAKLVSQQKTQTGEVTTTGQKNNGNKASGDVSMTAVVCGTIPDDSPAPVPSGTGVSANGLTYITQGTTSFSNSGVSKKGCLYYSATDTTTIIAQTGGASYNGATSFSVSGRKDISVSPSGDIAGGTDTIVQIASATDINNAKAKINSAANDSTQKQALQSQLKGEDYQAIVATYSAGTPSVTTSVQAGDAASTVTATQTTTYTMFGVHEDDLKTLVEADIKKQIDASKQSILDNGLSKAAYTVTNTTATTAQVGLAVTATAGPDLNINDIKQQAIGKKPAEIRSTLEANPDVTSVDVQLSPFFVGSVPKKTEKINVVVAKPSTTKPSASSSDNP